MAYRIAYEWNNEPKSVKKHRIPVLIWAGMLLVGTVLTLRILVPQWGEFFRAMLYPLTDEATIDAFGTMIDSLGAGVQLPEALAAFCAEILEHAR